MRASLGVVCNVEITLNLEVTSVSLLVRLWPWVQSLRHLIEFPILQHERLSINSLGQFRLSAVLIPKNLSWLRIIHIIYVLFYVHKRCLTNFHFDAGNRYWKFWNSNFHPYFILAGCILLRNVHVRIFQACTPNRNWEILLMLLQRDIITSIKFLSCDCGYMSERFLRFHPYLSISICPPFFEPVHMWYY
jgi:hypothetical protein